MDNHHKDEKQPAPGWSSAAAGNSGSNDHDAAPREFPRPGAVSVAGAAPQGKPGRMSSRALKNPPPAAPAPAAVPVVRSEAVWPAGAGHGNEAHAVAHRHNSGSNLEPLEPEALLEPNSMVMAVGKSRPVVASSASVAARTSRRNDSKAVIRQEMNALRSQGIAQGPGAVSVSSTAGTATVAAPAPAPPSNSKAAIKREIEELRANPEMNRPGAHSVTTTAQEESNRKGGGGGGAALTRSERPSRRALRGAGDQQQSQQGLRSSITSSTVSVPGAQPSTSESTAAAEKAMFLKTQDATKPTGAVHASAADDKSKTLKLDSSTTNTASFNVNGSNKASSDAINKKTQDEKLLSPYDAKILDETAKGIPVESSKNGMTPKEAYNQKNDLHQHQATYAHYDDNDNVEHALAGADGLVAAQVIDEEELEAQYQAKMMKSVVAAEIVSEDELKERGRGWKMCCCCLLIIGIVLAIAIPLSKKGDDLTYPPTAAPTEQAEYDYLVDLFYPFSGDALEDNTTAQYRALQWIAYEDPLGLPIKESNETTIIERYTAAVLYYATGGELWSDSLGFMSNTSICQWNNGVFGITCDDTEQYADRIDIDSNNLNGTIPTELLGFSRLGLLSLGYGLRGTLPSELGDMRALTFLQVFSTDITGTIPSTYTRLPLQAISMFDNLLTGTIPSDLFREKYNLEYILLYQNQFTGPLPEIRRQAAILHLDFHMNLFEGTIPQVYMDQDNLVLLGLSDNLLTGTIPEQIRALKRLEFFYGSQNSFTGTIPSGMDTLRDLQEYLVAENMLTGGIPIGFGQLDMLTKLSLANNQLTGSLPSELGSLVTLIQFNVSSNPLTGTVPSSLLQMTSMTDFDVSRTDIVGGLEETFCSQSILSTSIAADCLGNSSSTVTCSCCSSCCNDDECEVNLVSMCTAKSAEFALASDRGTTCNCQDEGAKMSCSDAACESCNVDGSVCAQSTDYGYTFDPVTGETLSFRNVLQYTKGRNETVEYTKKPDENFCTVVVDGEKCRSCTPLTCESSYQGFQVDCSNLPDGPILYSCFNKQDVSFLEVFYLVDLSLVAGCPPVLINLQPNNSG